MFQIVQRSEYLTHMSTRTTKFSVKYGLNYLHVSGSTGNFQGFYLYYQSISDGKMKAAVVCVLESFFGASVGIVLCY